MKKIIILSLLIFAGCTGKIGETPVTNVNQEELSKRMTPVNADVEFVSIASTLDTNIPKFTHISTIAAPTVSTVYGSRTLKVTSTLKLDNLLYITYNLEGPEVFGALDIVNIQNLATPVLVSSTLFPNHEFNDLKARGRALYLAGNKKDVGACVVVMDIANAVTPILANELLMAGNVATSLDVRNGMMFVSSAIGGGITRYEVPWLDVLYPQFIRYNPFPNALFVKAVYNPVGFNQSVLEPLILGGSSDTHLYFIDEELQFSPLASQAPSRLVMSGPMVYSNLTTAGLKVTEMSKMYDERGFEGFVSTLALPGTGNGIAHHDQRLYVARGESGVRYVDVDEPGAPQELGYIKFSDQGSANDVWVERYAWSFKVLAIANGTGGVRLVVEDSTAFKNAGDWIKIYAKGTPVSGVNPLMQLIVNGTVVADNISVASDTWKVYHVNLPTAIPFGADVRVRFFNDGYIPGVDDRNLSIGYVKIGDDYYYPWWNNVFRDDGSLQFSPDSDNMQIFSNGYLKINR